MLEYGSTAAKEGFEALYAEATPHVRKGVASGAPKEFTKQDGETVATLGG